MVRLVPCLMAPLLFAPTAGHAEELPGVHTRFVDPLPRGEPRTPQAHQGGKQVIYVNFDGGTIAEHRPGGMAGDGTGAWSPFGDGAKREASWQAVKVQWAPFDVVLTDQKPDDPEYTLCMVGNGGRTEGTLGEAPVDCNNTNPSDVAKAYHNAADTWDAATVGTTISQELAHTFGLEHTNDAEDILFAVNRVGRVARFIDDCVSVDRVRGFDCPAQRLAYCPQDYQQNGFQELLGMFGPGESDTEPPVVDFVEPSAGAALTPGVPFRVEVSATDALGVDSVRLYVGGEDEVFEHYRLIGTGLAAPYVWETVTVDDPGVYVLVAEVADALLQTTIKERTIFVGVDPPADTGVDEDDGPDTADTGGTGVAADDSGPGCGCHSGAPGWGWTAPWAIAPVLLRRRRRRARPTRP